MLVLSKHRAKEEGRRREKAAKAAWMRKHIGAATKELACSSRYTDANADLSALA